MAPYYPNGLSIENVLRNTCYVMYFLPDCCETKLYDIFLYHVKFGFILSTIQGVPEKMRNYQKWSFCAQFRSFNPFFEGRANPFTVEISKNPSIRVLRHSSSLCMPMEIKIGQHRGCN